LRLATNLVNTTCRWNINLQCNWS